MLQGLMAPSATPTPAPAPASPEPGPAAPRRGAVGAISSAVSALRANAVVELDPHAIRPGGLEDRIEDLAEDDAALRRSMAEHGQQVPVLVRPHPREEGAWQIVYGRRRVLAARDLGVKVKALVRALDDEALVLAQGQENSARRDLSFIEKAHFARAMEAAGYTRQVICAALTVDKTVVSRMIALMEQIPDPVLRAIGAAHGIGRPRWQELATLLQAAGLAAQDAADLAAVSAPGPTSTDRFEGLMTALRRHGQAARDPAPAEPPLEIRAADGTPLARARRSARGLSLTLAPGGFDDWLVEHLAELHARWRAQEPPAGGES